MSEGKWRYCVLYVKSIKSWEVTEVLRRALPEGRGEVFYPCAELWMRGQENPVIRPLWPGYIFIRTNLSFLETHQMIREHRWDVESFISEVHLKRKIVSGDFEYDIGEGGRDPILCDLKDDEAEFLDFMLNFREGETGFSGVEGKEDVPPIRLVKGGRKFPTSGALRASYGYRQNGKVVVMEGPLKGMEDHITGYNARDKKAYLDVKIGDKNARAGLKLMGKRHWYPNDKDAPEVLKDGTEVDANVLARKMMGGR